MATEQEQAAPGLAEAMADIQVVREQLIKSGGSDETKFEPWRAELLNNILPLIEGIAAAAQQEVNDLDDVIEDMGDALDEIIDNKGEVLMPETAAKIGGVLECGKLIADELEKVMGKLDDVAKRKSKELIKMYRQGVALIAKDLAEITIDPEQPQPANAEPGADAADPDDKENA